MRLFVCLISKPKVAIACCVSLLQRTEIERSEVAVVFKRFSAGGCFANIVLR